MKRGRREGGGRERGRRRSIAKGADRVALALGQVFVPLMPEAVIVA
jgi:hypothetical protein